MTSLVRLEPRAGAGADSQASTPDDFSENLREVPQGLGPRRAKRVNGETGDELAQGGPLCVNVWPKQDGSTSRSTLRTAPPLLVPRLHGSPLSRSPRDPGGLGLTARKGSSPAFTVREKVTRWCAMCYRGT